METLEQLAAALSGIGIARAYAGPLVEFDMPQEPHAPPRARTPLPALRPFQWLHSFSSLTRKVQSVENETLATDETEAEPVDADLVEAAEDARLLALQYQRGPRFGDAVHNILERANAGVTWPDQRALLVHELHAQGLRAGMASDAGALEAVGRMVDRVRGGDLCGGLRLNDLTIASRVAEFEFQFPLHKASVAQLRSICAAHGYTQVLPAHVAHATLDGMLTGFIDLVFAHDGRYHVLDYKTNWLGARLSDYAAPALAAAMREHHYELQALLYTVALHRHLQGRLDGYTAETHLGESCYLFLRAFGLEPGLGIWRRRWPAALIRAIDAAFAGAAEVA